MQRVAILVSCVLVIAAACGRTSLEVDSAPPGGAPGAALTAPSSDGTSSSVLTLGAAGMGGALHVAGGGGASAGPTGAGAAPGAGGALSGCGPACDAGAGGSSGGPGLGWAERFGDGDDQVAQGIAVDAAGNLVVSGVFRGSVDFGGGPLVAAAGGTSVFVVKLDPAGNHLWSRRFGDPARQGRRSMAVDGAGHVLLAGCFQGTADFGGGPLTSDGKGPTGCSAFVTKLSPGGQPLWTRSLGGDVAVDALTVDAAGAVLFAGTLEGPSGPNLLVSKLDPGGDPLWSRRFGDGDGQFPADIAVDGAGHVLLAGAFGASLDFGGGPLPLVQWPEVFVAKLDAAGEHVWSRAFPAAGYQVATSVTAGPAGEVTFAGTFIEAIDLGGGALPESGSYQNFVARLDAAGDHVWSERVGDPTFAVPWPSITSRGAGEVLVLSGVWEAAAGGAVQSISLSELGPGGELRWEVLLGRAPELAATGLALSGQGALSICGEMSGATEIAGTPLVSGGGLDALVASFALGATP